MKAIEAACLANLEDNVRDAALREKLRPTYRAGCKRMIFSSDFYQAIAHPNASLVTESIERVETNGVRTSDGKLHELDVLVLATGFRAEVTQLLATERGEAAQQIGRRAGERERV
mgnify:CR=1 FL=1